uniref:Uncharacterized protein n=3 Tax=Oryza TaxID=4527 RepID=A0A0E0N4S4_ORYRU
MWGTTAAAARRLCAAGDVRSVLAMLACRAKAGDTALDMTACAALVRTTGSARAAMWRKPGGRELIQGSEVDHGNEAEGFGSKFRKEAEALLDDMVRAGLQTSEPICQFTECQGKIERFY